VEPRRFCHRLRAVSLLAAAIVLSQCLVSSWAQTPLSGHSIGAPPNIQSLSTDWFLQGTAVPTSRHLVLSPGVPNRLGLFWSKYPLLSKDFEVSFTFTAQPPQQRTTKEDGFAFWYVHENASDAQSSISVEHLHSQDEITANTWGTAFVAENFDLFGYRSAFDGLGVFFCDGVVDKKPQAMISAIAGDGATKYLVKEGVPSADALKVDYHTGKAVTVKIRVQTTKATLEVSGHKYELKGTFKTGGYIGFSAFGGLKGAVTPSERSDFLELLKVDVRNFDQSSKGEDMPKIADLAPEPPTVDKDKEDILHELSTFKDHRAESEAIKELTNMVFKLVVESQPMRAQMVKSIESLGKRVTLMEKTFASLKSELEKKTGVHLTSEFEAIKKELTSLSKVASSETQERHKKLESLHEDIAHVHKSATSEGNIDHHLDKLTKSNQRTLDSLTSEHQKMFGVSIAAIAFIIIAGMSLYNKFRCWEKKHVL